MEGSEKLTVDISRMRPYKFFTNFKRRVTLRTLKILISWGAKGAPPEDEPKLTFEIKISIMDAQTMKKSNLDIIINVYFI